ncbi:MAG: purine-nucleoside phosphorylase, partial [Ginsengibacter sp.]
MNDIQNKIDECSAFLKKIQTGSPTIGIVLGTGLGALVDKINVKAKVSYSEIPHFPVATVEFHRGALIFGTVGDKNVVIMQGRFHYYEGYSMQQITFPVRVMKKLGVQHLLLSNAAGGINKDYKKGDLIIINDHINLQPENPLRGLNDPSFGNRFVDMCRPYDPTLNKALNDAAAEMYVDLKNGVYAAVPGP